MSDSRADLDPADWAEFRRQSHRMLDDMLDFLEHVRERPVWQPVPDAVKQRLAEPLPAAPTPLDRVYDEFRELVLPYATGNIHPAFFGWVHGGGTPTGMLAEMLAGAMNANLGGREHAPVHVERQVIGWCREIFGFPETAGGLLVTGTSLANLIALLVARTARLGPAIRDTGLQAAQPGQLLVAYASAAAHSCVRKAMEMSGLGGAQLRIVPTESRLRRIDVAALARMVREDRAAGLAPFFAVGTAGTVDTGAVDDLAALADLCAEEDLWFHVDGAFGALAMLSPALRPLLRGIERADSLAFDFHKWGQVPYDAGCILVRDGTLQRQTFAAEPAYLARAERGLGGGAPWFCDFGPDLSRGFRALKVWFTFKEHGAGAIGATIEKTCRLARRLEARIAAAAPELELMAPVTLNVVCFRYRGGRPDDGAAAAALDALNREIVADAQEAGIAAPSTTVLDGRLAIRAAIVNHRSADADIDRLVDFVLARGPVRAAAITGET
ncbi:MAG TPA: pyridoxal-dependent decarboxylase [Stellaceae bacterium]|jgi:glutamate/tyrosine decarboxylase-like PLP-dependent enzyme